MNIVLAPGLFGFSRLGPADYFRGVKVHLEDRFPGIRVLAASTNPTGSVESRAGFLANQIIGFLQPLGPSAASTARVHIIAHSMGGLDARYVAAHNLSGLTARIVAITTVGTPHNGSPVATFVDAFNPLSALGGVLHVLTNSANIETHPLQSSAVLKELSQYTGAVHDLSESAAKAFDAANTDVSAVSYAEVVGIGRSTGPITSDFFLPTHAALTAIAALRGQDKRNDGIVPYASAVRPAREPFDIWQADHADMIGWNLDDPAELRPSSFEHLPRYERLVQRIV